MSITRTLARMAAAVLLLGVTLILLSVLSNAVAPGRSSLVERLAEPEKARLSEAQHVRRSLGDSLWPGWAEADTPLIVYNEEYAFLVGYADPGPGWTKVPQNLPRGGPWEPVPGDTFEGQVYYRQRLAPGITPEAFTVLVDDRWAASLPTREWYQISLGDPLRADLGPLFPYRLAARFLAGSSDKYITLVLHESFHAYQGLVAPERLARAERVLAGATNCSWDDGRVRAAWQAEMNVLAEAVAADTDQEARRLARDFLAQRDARRANAGLSAACVELEQQREWLEGLAKYTELAMWRQAAASPGYQPLAAVRADPDFKAYAEAEARWSQEVNQIKLSGAELEDNGLYYSGMGQAALLSRLAPGVWARVLKEATSLEELLRATISSAAGV